MFHLSFTDNCSDYQLFGGKNRFSYEGWNEGLSFTRNYSVFKHFRSESEGLKDIFE
jgi:hypothetical protein